MSLNLDWRECKSERVRKNAFEAGVLLMSIGIDEVTEKLLPEVAFRITMFQAITGTNFGFTADELLGLTSNVAYEPFTRWAKRVHDYQLRHYKGGKSS
jgi:hypothetical protein